MTPYYKLAFAGLGLYPVIQGTAASLSNAIPHAISVFTNRLIHRNLSCDQLRRDWNASRKLSRDGIAHGLRLIILKLLFFWFGLCGHKLV